MLEKTINNAICALLFRCEQQSVKEIDKIHAMQLFIKVAELESFSRAADFFALPKGSVSRQIQALEHQLGTQLLQRTTRRVKLTPEGMTYYQRAKDVLSNLSELDGLFQQDATSISGKLRIDIPSGIAKSLLLPRLSEFLYLHPGIELELSSHDRPVDILHDGFDCVIRTGALPEDGVIARSLGKLTMVNCASPHYLTRFGYPQSPDDLTSHAIVRYTPHLGVHPLGFEVASVNGVQWFKSGGMLTVNSSENYLAAGIAGLGIIQIPRIAVREALRAGRLIEVLPGYRAEPLSLSLVYPQRRELSRRVNLFMQWLAGVMKEQTILFKNNHDRRTKERMTQENEIKRPTQDLEHEPIKQLDNSEKGGKVSQALETVTTTAEKVQRQPVIAHLIRATERFNDRLGNQFGAAITYFSFLSMIPILMVSFAAGGFVLASHPMLLQDIFDKILQNISDPTLAATLKNTINTAVQQRTTVGLVGLAVALYSGINWMGNLREAIRAQSRDVWERSPQDQEKFWVKYLRDFISLIGLLIALIVTLSITSVAGSAQQMIISALHLNSIEWLKPTWRLIGLAISIFANYLLFFWIFWRLPRHRPRKKALIRGTFLAAIGFEVIKIVMTYTLPSLMKSPSGAAFGSVLGLMAFFYFFARLTLFCAAWIATAEYKDDPRMPGKTQP